DPDHDPHGGRLAGAVGADEAEDLPRLDGEAEPVERHRRAVALAEPVEFEHARGVLSKPGEPASSSRAAAAACVKLLGVRLIVDGMNVIGSRADGWWRDRDAAMARLVDLL